MNLPWLLFSNKDDDDDGDDIVLTGFFSLIKQLEQFTILISYYIYRFRISLFPFY